MLVRGVTVNAVRGVVGVREGFIQEALDVGIGRGVVGEGALASNLNQSGKA